MSKMANLMAVGDTCLEKSRALYKRVLRAQEKVLGLEHGDTLTTCNNFAALLNRLGDMDESLFLYERASSGRCRQPHKKRVPVMVAVGIGFFTHRPTGPEAFRNIKIARWGLSSIHFP